MLLATCYSMPEELIFFKVDICKYCARDAKVLEMKYTWASWSKDRNYRPIDYTRMLEKDNAKMQLKYNAHFLLGMLKLTDNIHLR